MAEPMELKIYNKDDRLKVAQIYSQPGEAAAYSYREDA